MNSTKSCGHNVVQGFVDKGCLIEDFRRLVSILLLLMWMGLLHIRLSILKCVMYAQHMFFLCCARYVV